jgi:hypothetical protein
VLLRARRRQLASSSPPSSLVLTLRSIGRDRSPASLLLQLPPLFRRSHQWNSSITMRNFISQAVTMV